MSMTNETDSTDLKKVFIAFNMYYTVRVVFEPQENSWRKWTFHGKTQIIKTINPWFLGPD